MLDEPLVRVAAAALAGAYAAVALASLVAARLRGPLVPRAVENPPRGFRFGWGVLRLLLFAYPAAVAAAPSRFYAPAVVAFPGDVAAQYAGAALAVVALLVLAWSAALLGRLMSAPPGVVAGHALATRGPYAIVRHPAYAALVLLAVAEAALFLSWILAALAAFLAVLASALAEREERALGASRSLGEAYRAYAARTPRWLPGWR